MVKEADNPTPETTATETRFLDALENVFTYPLTPEAINPEFIKTALKLTEIDNPERLKETKMRPAGKDKPAYPKYLAVKQALGADRFNAYEAWTNQVSTNSPQLMYKKSGKKSGRRNRGLMQFSATLVACGLGQMTAEECCHDINTRVGTTLNRQKPPPENISQYAPNTRKASLPEGSLIEAWQFLTQAHESTQN